MTFAAAIIVVVLFVLELAVVSVLLRNIKRSAYSEPPFKDAISLAARYRPMLRLLDEPDASFIVSSQNNKSQLQRFRAERRSLFRVYLYQLDADHARLLAAVRSVLVESNIDRPDLAKRMYRMQFRFSLAIYGIEWQLFLHELGLISIDLRHLVAAADASQRLFRDCLSSAQ